MNLTESQIRKIISEEIRVVFEAVTFDNNKTFNPPPNVAQRAQEALNNVSNNNLTQSGTNDGSGLSKAWELHGCDSGKDWVNQEMNSLNQSNLDTKKNLRKSGGAATNKGMGIFDTN